jgi:hypothetical protein
MDEIGWLRAASAYDMIGGIMGCGALRPYSDGVAAWASSTAGSRSSRIITVVTPAGPRFLPEDAYTAPYLIRRDGLITTGISEDR